MSSLALIFDLVAKDGASPVFLRGAAAADKMAAATARATAGAATAASRMDKVAASTARFGATMTKHFTVPILAVAGVSAKMASDFNAAMTRIQTQAGASAKDVRSLTGSVLDLAKYAQQGPTELADALYHLKSVGMDNVSAMKALKQASDLAAVGHANLEDTTNALAGAWKTGIRGAQNFHAEIANLNAIIGSGNIKMADLVAALGTGILPTAKTFGLTMKDVGAALALFTDEGVPADAAMTRLRMSVSLFGAPSKAAEKQLKTIGLTGLDLARDMRKPNGLLVAVQ
jgi:TP901 family phage tail tape measure protein